MRVRGSACQALIDWAQSAASDSWFTDGEAGAVHWAVPWPGPAIGYRPCGPGTSGPRRPALPVLTLTFLLLRLTLSIAFDLCPVEMALLWIPFLSAVRQPGQGSVRAWVGLGTRGLEV